LSSTHLPRSTPRTERTLVHDTIAELSVRWKTR
jgi:hypothetical protein